jgi:hypothetical protein
MLRISSPPRSVLVLWAAAAVAAVAPARAGADVGSAAGAVASNVAVTIQLLWQVQQGCARECVGTSQTQEAAQEATTVQIAAATGDGASASKATNNAATIQLIVQTQLGCVAFCIGTTRVQVASQRADATQMATAISGALAASATNTMYFSQLVWQYQDVCLETCVDVNASQVVQQAATGVQAAGGDVGTLPPPPAVPDLGAFTTWLATVAGAATVDVVQQQDVAACLQDCAGDVQVQISVQQATTAQASVATSAAPARTDAPATPAATAAADVPVAPAATAPADAAGAPRPFGVARRQQQIHRHHRRARVRSARARSTLHHRRSTGGIHRGT